MTQVHERPTRAGDAGLGINGAGINDLGINGLAASWYVAMPAQRLRAEPVALRLFGQDLVAWRDGAGRPVIMPRYCPHQGASLAIGSVADGCLRCPFHGWRFDATGTCVLIPGSPHIPSTAALEPYPSVERYGYVWAWYGGGEPLFELPDFPALEGDRDSYVGFRYADRTTGTARLLLENAIDYFHFVTLHGLELDPMEFRVLRDPLEASDNGAPIAADAWFGAWFDGAFRPYSLFRNPLKRLAHATATFAAGAHLQLLVDGWPGGQRFTAYVDGREIYKVFLALTPVDDRRTSQLGWAAVRRTGRAWRTLFNLLVLYGGSRVGTAQDMPIYHTTEAAAGGFHVPYDRGVLEFRRYYQSWVDRAGGAP